MSIQSRLLTMLGAKASVIGLPPGDQPDRPLEKTFDDYTILSTYSDDPWPYICATKVAEQGSLPPLRIGTENSDGEFKPVPPNDPLQQLLDRPNSLNTGGEFRQLMLLYMEMVGHAPIEVVRPVKGAMLNRGTRAGFELYVHNPGPWRIVANADGTVRGYIYLLSNSPLQGMQAGMVSSKDLRWTPDTMTYLRWPNPLNRWYGQGRIAAVRQAVMAEEYAAIRDKKFEQQMGVPPGILTSEMPLGTPQAEELQRRWEKAVGGYQNAGRVAVLGSKTTYQPVALNARDSEWLTQRHWRVQEIAGAFEVPLVLVLMSEATYANAKEARAEWWEGSLSVKLGRIEEMVTERLIPMLTDRPLIARFDLSKIAALNENEKEVADIAEIMVRTASFTKGEIRKRLGHQPFGDERDDELALPTQFRDTLVAESFDAANPNSGQDTAKPADQPTPPPKKDALVRRIKAHAERDRALDPVRAQYRANLSTFFVAQRGALLSTFKEASPDAQTLIDRAVAILTAKRFRERLQRISEPAVKAAFGLGVEDAAEAMRVSVTWSIGASPEALAAVNARLVGLSESLQGTTVDDVTRIITEALAKGEDMAAMRADLATLFDGYQDWRLDRITRTETTNAYNVGSVGQYRDAGVSQVYVTDGDGDDECAEADGSTWSLEEAESNPTSHPNCTRSFDPVLVEDTMDQSDELVAASREVERIKALTDLLAVPEPVPTKMHIELGNGTIDITEVPL